MSETRRGLRRTAVPARVHLGTATSPAAERARVPQAPDTSRLDAGQSPPQVYSAPLLSFSSASNVDRPSQKSYSVRRVRRTRHTVPGRSAWTGSICSITPAVRACLHMHTRLWTHTHVCTRTSVHAHASAHAHTSVDTHACLHTHICACTCVCTRTYMSAHTSVHAPACLHMHTFAQACLSRRVVLILVSSDVFLWPVQVSRERTTHVLPGTKGWHTSW